MAESMIRGYSLRRTAAFIDAHFDAETAARVKRRVPEAVEIANNVRPADWYPRIHSVTMFRAIASAKGAAADPDAAYADLVACGTYISSEATNTFFRVLLKIMTPALFAKKLPAFWERDQKGGRYEYDISRIEDKIIGLRLVDVADYDYIGPVATGFLEFVFNAMGKRGFKVTVPGWSFEHPAQRNIDFHVTWQ
jgi:hypothetical protein